MGLGGWDYRSERMGSPEGTGKARRRWEGFHSGKDARFLAVVREAEPELSELPEPFRDELAEAVAERSELVGFWIAWQLAGGFENLERGGWNRSTIYRKLRRFRSVFGVHPDTARFSWLELRHEQAWNDEMTRLLRMRFPQVAQKPEHGYDEGPSADNQEPAWVVRGLARDPADDPPDWVIRGLPRDPGQDEAELRALDEPTRERG